MSVPTDRDLLAAALRSDILNVTDERWIERVTEALLPVVQKIAADKLRAANVPGLAESYAAVRVAAALRAAADEWPDAYASSVSDWLHDRADSAGFLA